MKLALLHNPRSGYNRCHPRSVPEAAAQNGIPCWQASGEDELVPAMQSIAATAPDVLIVNGGDGTVDAVVTCLRRTVRFAAEPALAILPGGSTNMIALDVGFAARSERAMRQIASSVRTGDPGVTVLRRPFAVSGPGVPGRLGFFLAGGALPALLRRSRPKEDAPGVIGPGVRIVALLRTTLQLLAGNTRDDPVLRPRTVDWSVDTAGWGHPASSQKRSGCRPGHRPGGWANASRIPGEAPHGREEIVLFFVTTLERMVMGIRPGQTDPGLRFLALRSPYRNIVGSVAGLVRGRPFHTPDANLIFRAGERMHLEFEGDVEFDGESLPVGPGPASLELALDEPLTFWRVQA